MSENHVFEPRILAFCCHHCAYVAADLTGWTSSRHLAPLSADWMG